MLVVFGTVCLDRVRRLPHLPAPGGYVEVTEETTHLGGEAANTALSLLAWGDAPVLASNPLGDDAAGTDLRARVVARGLDLCELRGAARAEAPVCDVLVTPDGERTMIGRGFSRLDSVVDLGALPVRSGGLFSADPNLAETSRAAVRAAQAAGMRAYLMDFLRPDDPLGPGSFWQSSTDWAGTWGGVEANLAHVDALAARTGAFCILTDGPNGLVAGGPGLPARHYPPFPAPTRVDTTGAGDAFRAGMLHGLARGWALPVCLQFAAAAGALAVGRPGASTEIPTRSQIASLIAESPQVVVGYS